MDYESIKSFFDVKHQNKDQCMAICPCHNDKNASLSISYSQSSGKTLIYCHAGCDTGDVLSRVGLRMQDLFDEGCDSKGGRRTIESVYKYTDADGSLLFEKVRFKPKSFSQRRYVGGNVVWGLDEGMYYETYAGSGEFSKNQKSGVICLEFPRVVPVLYNLPGIIRAVNNRETVYIVEGEKDSDNLIKLGLAATTTFDGATKSRDNHKWRNEYNAALRGADVVLIPDNDDAGIQHMMNIAKELQGVAKSIKIVELQVPHKEDVSYYLEEGHTLDELLNLVKTTSAVCLPPSGKNVSLLTQVLSDVGNAERVIALYGSSIRYDFIRDKFFIWNGHFWQMDISNSIYKLAKNTLRRLMAEVDSLDAKEDKVIEDMKSRLKSFAVRSENDSRIKAIVNQLKSQSEIMHNEWDSDLYLLNLSNGTLNLKTGRLENHNKNDYITRIISIDYEEKASCPDWLEFLNKVFVGDEDMMDFVQRSIGYSITGSQEEQCFYMLYGSGANGKSTFLNTIKMITGDYSDTLRASSLMARQYDDGARGDLAKLQAKRFVCASELNEGQYFDESLIKSLTGGETIPVRFLYSEEFSLKPCFKIWLATNEKPRIKGTDLGIWRRVRLIPFLYTFTDDERDKNFMEKHILPELPGILNWAVQGSLKWLKEGISIPEKSLAETEDYRQEMDVVQRFVDETCILGDIYTIKVNDLYMRFNNWCSRLGDRAMTSIKFGKKLKEKGFEQSKDKHARYWKGIGVYSIR